ncbi:hypothetical protein GGE07_005373 [Sinorhizobium terangae]|nr:hypothetical protein [Sinorhizobium terangae]
MIEFNRSIFRAYCFATHPLYRDHGADERHLQGRSWECEQTTCYRADEFSRHAVKRLRLRRTRPLTALAVKPFVKAKVQSKHLEASTSGRHDDPRLSCSAKPSKSRPRYQRPTKGSCTRHSRMNILKAPSKSIRQLRRRRRNQVLAARAMVRRRRALPASHCQSASHQVAARYPYARQGSLIPLTMAPRI